MFLISGVPLLLVLDSTVSDTLEVSREAAELEESRQDEERDAFFNSDDSFDSYVDISGDTVTEQLVITNGLLGTTNALLIIFMIFGVMRFVSGLLRDNIFHNL